MHRVKARWGGVDIRCGGRHPNPGAYRVLVTFIFASKDPPKKIVLSIYITSTIYLYFVLCSSSCRRTIGEKFDLRCAGRFTKNPSSKKNDLIIPGQTCCYSYSQIGAVVEMKWSRGSARSV